MAGFADGPRGPKKKETKYAGLKKDKSMTSSFNMPLLTDNAMEVVSAIVTVLENGDLVSFSMTSDQGALVLCIMSHGEKVKEYIRTADELSDVLGVLTV